MKIARIIIIYFAPTLLMVLLSSGNPLFGGELAPIDQVGSTPEEKSSTDSSLVSRIFQDLELHFQRKRTEHNKDALALEVGVDGGEEKSNSIKIDAVQSLPTEDIIQKPNKRIYGWTYAGENAYENLQFDVLSTLSVSYDLKVTANGYSTAHWNFSGLADAVQKAHRYGCRIELSMLYAASEHPALFANHKMQDALIVKLCDYVKLYHLDGINLDVEFLPATQKDAYYRFIKELSTALKKQKAGLSVATPAADWDPVYVKDSMDVHIERYIIMGYDYLGSKHAVPIAPLGPSAWNKLCLQKTVEEYLAAGYSKDKLILALPFYGAIWTTGHHYKDPQSNLSSTSTKLDQKISYASLLASHPKIEQECKLDNLSMTQYFEKHNGLKVEQIWFDGLQTLPLKIKFAEEQGLSGIGVWNIDYCNDTLWHLLKTSFELTKPFPAKLESAADALPEATVEKAIKDIDDGIDTASLEFFQIEDLMDKEMNLVYFLLITLGLFALAGLCWALMITEVRYLIIEAIMRFFPFLNRDLP